MICSNCGTENRAGRRFCLKCGFALPAGCPNCGTDNEAEADFCGNCGSSLGVTATIQPRSTSPAAERRLVTILFADLVGFTPFAEERDPEDVRVTLERYASIAREVVGRYGGTVEKFIGDAVMAVWGTPTAHEDDAERAVRAALDLTESVRSLGADIQARAGVLTGEAAVNLLATDQALLAGDLVNSAARLQSVAPPGSVLVGESTMHATSAAIAFEPAGGQALKGKSALLAAWRALRVIAQRRGAGRADAVETPFVGREEEFRILRDQLHLAGRDPRARLVSVTGPAGIGKSRLAWELEKYVDGVVETIYWHRGRCPAYGAGVSFWALGEMVRRRAALAEGDDEATTRERVGATVAEYVADESERAWIEQALLVLLGVEEEVQAGRETLFAAWRRFFEHIAARGTTVLVFEDLHWADSGLLDFIDHVLDWSKQVPLLIVTLARPELFDRRPDWGAARRSFTALALDPLPDDAMRGMLAAIVPDLPEPALAAIVARADGIPLYAVETVRMLLADGRLIEADGHYRAARELGDLEVPDSLRSLITSRLDALDGADRRLVQDASVLGGSFTVAALAGVTGAPADELEGRLRQLVRRELFTIEADPRSPERGQYGFTQALIGEVAYSTLARADRRERHLAAARHIESAGSDELAGVLAGHYLSAHEVSSPGPEADAVAVQARIALRAAAERASALGGHKQAATFLGQALTVTTTPAERAPLLEAQAVEHDRAGQYAASQAAANGAIDEYAALGDGAGLARSRTILGADLIHAARIADAVAVLEVARSDVPAGAEPAVIANVLTRLAHAYYRNRETQRSLETVDPALELAEHHRLRHVLADAMVTRGTALSMSARISEGLVVTRGGVELARREGNVEAYLRGAANMLGMMASEESTAQAMAVAFEALDVARKAGDIGMVVWHLGGVAVGSCFAGLPLRPVIDAIDETLELDLAPSDRARLLRRKEIAATFLGLDTAELRRELELVPEPTTDAQRIGSAHFDNMLIEIALGQYDRASDEAELATEAAHNYGFMTAASVMAAIGGDDAKARRQLARAREMPIPGRLEEYWMSAAVGLVNVIDGRSDLGLAAFRDSWRAIHDMEDILAAGLITLAFMRRMGGPLPELRAAAEIAIAEYERMGAMRMAEEMRAELGGASSLSADRAQAASPKPAESTHVGS